MPLASTSCESPPVSSPALHFAARPSSARSGVGLAAPRRRRSKSGASYRRMVAYPWSGWICHAPR
eukprot:4736351-Prymnesium_polylepis.2